MNPRTFDISRLSINFLSACVVAVAVFKVGLPIAVNLHDLSRDVRELRGTIAESAKQSSQAHEDAEAALRDGVDKGTRLKALESSDATLKSWFAWEWSYAHGRIDKMPWHNPHTPPPNLTEPPPEGL